MSHGNRGEGRGWNWRIGAAALVLSLIALAVLLAGVNDSAFAAPKGKRVFDHARTGFPLLNAHARTRCESCHLRGVFEGTPRKCLGCHGHPRFATNFRLGTHPPTSDQCDLCHNTNNWLQLGSMDHHAAKGACGTCHNGRKFTGKPPDHIPTSLDCAECHSTASWSGARFDHQGITGACASCHNGVQATGKPPRHVPTIADCSVCHNTTSFSFEAKLKAGDFSGEGRFTHRSMTANCSGCHNGVKAQGKLPGHVASTADCGNCHTATAWAKARMDHKGIAAHCAACHNGTAAPGKPAAHLASSRVCEGCHRNTLVWASVSRVDHSQVKGACATCHNGAKAPGKPSHHPFSGNACETCHGTTSWSVTKFDHTPASGDCSLCHADDFRRHAHNKVNSPRILYTARELSDCAGACHVYKNAAMTEIQERRNGAHRVNARGW